MLKGHYYYLLLSQLSCYNQILIGQIGYYQQKFIPYSAGGWKSDQGSHEVLLLGCRILTTCVLETEQKQSFLFVCFFVFSQLGH